MSRTLFVMLLGILWLVPGTTRAVQEQEFPQIAKSEFGQAYQSTTTSSGVKPFIDQINDMAQFQTVFPPDERVRISPTNYFPASAISLVLVGPLVGSPWAGCSGTFIGPQVILTAAHCLYSSDFGGWVPRVEVYPGQDGSVSPYGYSRATNWWVPDGWEYGQDASWDWGLIKIPDAIGYQTNWFKIGVLSDQSLIDPHFRPTVGGYPGDKPIGTQWVSGKEAFLTVNAHTLFTDIDLAPGESGSAIWRRSDGIIVGVVVRESPGWNEANRIDGQFLKTLVDGCNTMRCEFDAYVEQAPPPTQPGPGAGAPAPAPSPPGTAAFAQTWQRTDQPVASQHVNRTWMWGPQGYTPAFSEPYAQAPGGMRTVQYFDKSRMEITNPSGDPNSPWYVTNGLLTTELITGRMQTGDSSFEQRSPAQVNVAGDQDDSFGPTYATFNPLMSYAPVPVGWKITQTLDRAGTVGNRDALGGYGVTSAVLVAETNHTVASVFWDFMNSSGLVLQNGQETQANLFLNPFYATGFPITEAYWSQVKVGGVVKDVLVQCFQRRCLTYTPSNPDGWKVEAGNVGQHYYRWRYGM